MAARKTRLEIEALSFSTELITLGQNRIARAPWQSGTDRFAHDRGSPDHRGGPNP
jgi:hypothetical protein